MNIIDYSKEYHMSSDSPHSPIFPKNIFAIIAGATSCGKTNLLINFVKQPKLIHYNRVYVYSTTLH